MSSNWGFSSAPPRDTRFDVLVIGSGVAGLASAYEAASAGFRVAVIEADPEPGGASMMSGGGCCVVGTRLQRAHGVTDSVSLALSDWARQGGPTADLDWAELYLARSYRDVYQWCEDLGVKWIELRDGEGNSVPRWHRPLGGGEGVLESIWYACRTLDVRYLSCSRAASLLMSGDGGVHGVRVAGDDWETELHARAVIVATGGFASNRAMLLDRVPELAAIRRFLCGGAPQAVGLGHDLLTEAGATFTCMDHVWLYPVGTPDPCDSTGSRGLVVRGVESDIWINEHGRRFHDERRRGGGSGTQALLAQPGQHCWGILDRSEADRMVLLDNSHYGSPTVRARARVEEFLRSSHHVWSADTPRDLAHRVGLPPDRVADAVAIFNRDVVTSGFDSHGIDDDHIEGHPISDAPFFAIEYMPLVQKNFGGVQTDSECRVLSQSGRPIAGLYAAGEVAGMAGGHINGRRALEGTMFGPCLLSGRIAGSAAAAYNRARPSLSS